ncbi:MAG: hypothetical protein ACJ74Z_06785 [Bryobacteraceae bacterium]|jgi:hypothetical protein
MKAHIFVFWAIPIWLAGGLHGQVSTPEIGIVRYADSAVRPIYGVEANLVVGKQIVRTADAVSFSDFGGLVAVNGHIQLIDRHGSVLGEYHSTETKPLLNIDGKLTTAVAYLPSQEALLYWTGTSFVATQLGKGSFSGIPTSVQIQGAHSAKLLATTNGGSVSEITISLDTNQPTSVKFLPGVQGPAFLHHAFVVFHDKQGLEVEAPNGSRQTVRLASTDLVIERMSSDWLHLSSARTQQSWALHLNNTALHLSEMPVPRPEEGHR